jgi:phage tail sheath protein FI
MIDLYDSPDRFIDIMVIPEYNSYEVVNYATALALKNNFVVLATPSGDTVQSVLTNVSNYNTENRGSLALYYPNVYYNNFVDNTGELQAIPACIAVLHAYAKTDMNTKWGAPAGVTRGNLTLVNSLAVKLSTEDLTVLYDNIIPVNGINDISGKGFIVWGNKTATSTSDFFDRVNVSRLVKYITKQAYLISWDYLFEPITLDLFTSWTSRVESLLSRIKTGYGLSDYRVIMDSSINTSETVARNELNGIIRIKPQEVAEFVNIDLTITDTIEVSVEE